MNAIEQAVELLENAWCTGALYEQKTEDGMVIDKHCAVGALAVATGSVEWVTQDNGTVTWDDDAVYSNVEKTPEIKALAEEIFDTDWFANLNEDFQVSMQSSFKKGELGSKEGYFSSIVYTFNDAQQTNEPVIEMFKMAAKRLDS